MQSFANVSAGPTRQSTKRATFEPREPPDPSVGESFACITISARECVFVMLRQERTSITPQAMASTFLTTQQSRGQERQRQRGFRQRDSRAAPRSLLLNRSLTRDCAVTMPRPEREHERVAAAIPTHRAPRRHPMVPRSSRRGWRRSRPCVTRRASPQSFRQVLRHRGQRETERSERGGTRRASRATAGAAIAAGTCATPMPSQTGHAVAFWP